MLNGLNDEEMARRLHEQLNGPDSPTAAPVTRRVRKPPEFYKPPQQVISGVTGLRSVVHTLLGTPGCGEKFTPLMTTPVLLGKGS